MSQKMTHFAIFNIFYYYESAAMKFYTQHPETIDY